MTAEVKGTEEKEYEYTAPVISHFYDKCLSPFCQWLVDNVVPPCMSPDSVTMLGICAAICAYVFARSEHFVVAGLLWQCYCILDNLDGKQARKLNMGSAGGEFLDHAVDSIVTSMAAQMVMLSMYDLNNPMSSAVYFRWLQVVLLLVSNIPFFLGMWSQHVVGKIIFGASTTSVTSGALDYVTVDEYNFMLIPGLCFLRAFVPGVATLPLNDLIPSWLVTGTNFFLRNAKGSDVFFGNYLMISCIIVSLVAGGNIFMFLFRPGGRKWVTPFAVWSMLVSVFHINPVVSCCTFSLMCFEMMVKRLKVHVNKIGYIYYPILILILYVVDWYNLFENGNISFPNGRIRDVDYSFMGLLMCYTVAVMFTYKNVIHERFGEPNTPWFLTGNEKKD